VPIKPSDQSEIKEVKVTLFLANGDRVPKKFDSSEVGPGVNVLKDMQENLPVTVEKIRILITKK